MNEQIYLNDKCRTRIEMEDENKSEKNPTQIESCCYRNFIDFFRSLHGTGQIALGVVPTHFGSQF